MAGLNAAVSTLLDITKRMDPNGSISAMGELLNQTNPVLQDMLWKEGNLPTGERVTQRTSLPSATWRRLNEGVAASKSTSAQYDEHCGILEAWHEVDKNVADLNGNTSAYRVSEARGHIEAMNQEMASTVFYGDRRSDDREFDGLMVRYNLKSGVTGENIIDCDSSAAATIQSMWVVGWGYDGVYGIYPKGSQAGLVHEDLGLTTVQTSTDLGGTRMRAYQDRFQWQCGLALRDWRYVVRVANLDVSDIDAGSTAAPDFAIALIKALHRLPQGGAVRYAIYCSKTIGQWFDIQRRAQVGGFGATAAYAAASGGGRTDSQWEQQNVMSFRGIPIRECDALNASETLVA